MAKAKKNVETPVVDEKIEVSEAQAETVDKSNPITWAEELADQVEKMNDEIENLINENSLLANQIELMNIQLEEHKGVVPSEIVETSSLALPLVVHNTVINYLTKGHTKQQVVAMVDKVHPGTGESVKKFLCM